MTDSGWIKLHRQSLDSQVWHNSHLWKLWCYCLLKANHEDKWVPVDGVTKPVLVKRGQFITGRFALHKALYPRQKSGPSPRTVWRWLRNLQNMENLTIKTTNKYTLVTVCNYETYQSTTTENVQQVVQQLSNNCPQTRTNKKYYSPNSDEFRLAQLLFDEIRKRKPDHKEPNLNKWARQVDLMIRCDKRKPDRIEKVIYWCQEDEFWQNNVLCTEKLRKQFDQLELKMQKQSKPQPEPLRRDANGLTPGERFKAELEDEKRQKIEVGGQYATIS